MLLLFFFFHVRGNGDYWHSTTIAEAPEPKLVFTSTGSLYKLNGRMNKLVAYDYGTCFEYL